MQSGFQIILLSQNFKEKRLPNLRANNEFRSDMKIFKKNIGSKKIRWQGAGIWKFTSNLKTLSGFTLVSQSLRPLEDFNPQKAIAAKKILFPSKKNDKFPNFPS